MLWAFTLQAWKWQNSVRFIQIAFTGAITKLADVEVVRKSRFSKCRYARGLIFNLLGNWKYPKISACNVAEVLMCPPRTIFYYWSLFFLWLLLCASANTFFFFLCVDDWRRFKFKHRKPAWLETSPLKYKEHISVSMSAIPIFNESLTSSFFKNLEHVTI